MYNFSSYFISFQIIKNLFHSTQNTKLFNDINLSLQYKESQKNNQKAQQLYENLQKQHEELKQQKDQFEQQTKQLQSSLNVYVQQVETLTKTSAQQQTTIKEQNDQIETLNKQLSVLQEKFEKLYKSSLNSQDLQQYISKERDTTVQQSFYLKIKGPLGQTYYFNASLKLSSVKHELTLTKENYLMIQGKYLINRDGNLVLESELPLEIKQAAWYINYRTHQLTSLYDNKVFDCCGGKIYEGVKVILWKYHGKANQKWLIE